jgi:uncharacterized protein
MTATLMQTPLDRAKPWYREPWPWLLMAGPAIVVVAAFATLYLAVSSDDGVVADDYYKQGLVINRVLAREQRGAALGLGAVVAIRDDGAVRADLHGRGDALPPDVVTLKLAHATRAGMDRGATLRRGAGGAYFGRVEPPPAGRWLVTLETDAWRLPTVEVAGRPALVRLGTEGAAP